MAERAGRRLHPRPGPARPGPASRTPLPVLTAAPRAAGSAPPRRPEEARAARGRAEERPPRSAPLRPLGPGGEPGGSGLILRLGLSPFVPHQNFSPGCGESGFEAAGGTH